MAMMTYPIVIEDGHVYAKVTLRDVVEKCDVSDLPFLSEVKRLYDENAKLVDVLHEVEQEAVYAYNCLQQDCEAVVDGQTHFFNKWWHAECECDRAKAQITKLQELAKQMHICLTRPKVYDGEQPYLTATECPYFTEGACDYNACGFERRMRDLGIEGADA